MAQTDLKKLVAYSSVSHMGYVLLGMAALNAAGINGAVLQMFNHGTITAMLFLLVGVIYDRAHHREINGFGGLGAEMPVYTALHRLRLLRVAGPARPVAASSARRWSSSAPSRPSGRSRSSRPGHHRRSPRPTLWMLQRVFLGRKNAKYDDPARHQRPRAVHAGAAGGLIVLLGVYPMPVLDLMKASAGPADRPR